jgi:diguanylate cyclase (GGDEF)-like protein
MDVNKAYSVSNIEFGDSKKKEDRNLRKNTKQDCKNSNSSSHNHTDAFAIEGLLDENLDPKVRMAFERLASQIEPLRNEIELARYREAYFKEASEQHSFLPILGRREFSRELSLTLSHLKDLNTAMLVILHLVNGDNIRQRLGRKMLDGALSHIAKILKSYLQSTDVIGNMGGNDFGLILLSGDVNSAQDAEKNIFDAISNNPYLPFAKPIPLEISIGIAILEDNMTVDCALQIVDQNLLNSLCIHFS